MDLLEIDGLRLRTEVGFSKHEVGKLQEILVNIQLKISRKAIRLEGVLLLEKKALGQQYRTKYVAKI